MFTVEFLIFHSCPLERQLGGGRDESMRQEGGLRGPERVGGGMEEGGREAGRLGGRDQGSRGGMVQSQKETEKAKGT